MGGNRDQRQWGWWGGCVVMCGVAGKWWLVIGWRVSLDGGDIMTWWWWVVLEVRNGEKVVASDEEWSMVIVMVVVVSGCMHSDEKW